MHIGIDFDNTIVNFDAVFFDSALERGLVPVGLKKSKEAIRDSIRLLQNGNELWTELQGIVYGLRMSEATLAPGLDTFLRTCRRHEVRVSVISHKSLYPAIGPKVDLRAAARGWISHQGFHDEFGISSDDIIFCGTLDEKISEIDRRGCTHFIDDLTEVLLHPLFPPGVERILYSPQGKVINAKRELVVCESWKNILIHFFGE